MNVDGGEVEKEEKEVEEDDGEVEEEKEDGQGVFARSLAGADAIAHRIGGFHRLSLAVKFLAGSQGQVRKAGEIEQGFEEGDQLVSTVGQSPIGQTAT